MKRTIIMALAICMATATSFAQEKLGPPTKNPHHMKTSKKYTCTMHPEVVMDKPGKCPKCGMDLVKMKSTKKAGKMKGDMKDMKM